MKTDDRGDDKRSFGSGVVAFTIVGDLKNPLKHNDLPISFSTYSFRFYETAYGLCFKNERNFSNKRRELVFYRKQLVSAVIVYVRRVVTRRTEPTVRRTIARWYSVMIAITKRVHAYVLNSFFRVIASTLNYTF